MDCFDATHYYLNSNRFSFAGHCPEELFAKKQSLNIIGVYHD